MAYSEGKSSAAYIGFFEGRAGTSLSAEVVIDLERALAKKEEHLSHMPKTEANRRKESEIHEARNQLRDVVGLMLLPPLEPAQKNDLSVAQESASRHGGLSN